MSNETDKRAELAKEARAMGLTFHPALGEVKLEKLIKDAKAIQKKEIASRVEETPDPEQDELIREAGKFEKAAPESKVGIVDEPVVKVEAVQEETKLQRIQRVRKEQTKLVRVIVRCNNENKKNWSGEIKTVICAAGTIKKFIPFDNEAGWHVPQVILDAMKESMCQKFKPGKLKNGQPHNVSYMTREYSIEELPQLTRGEIDSLAAEQTARGSID